MKLVTVEIRIQCKEIVGIHQRSEELALHLADPVDIEFQVIPRLCIGDHIPACRVRSVLSQRRKRVHSIAKTFRHFVAVLIKYEAG
ncbi:hypothetical protein D3C86_1756670 [compost metagenome]